MLNSRLLMEKSDGQWLDWQMQQMPLVRNVWRYKWNKLFTIVKGLYIIYFRKKISPMKSIVLTKYSSPGNSFEIREQKIPEPHAGQVLVTQVSGVILNLSYVKIN